jgi:hypothetical protein
MLTSYDILNAEAAKIAAAGAVTKSSLERMDAISREMLDQLSQFRKVIAELVTVIEGKDATEDSKAATAAPEPPKNRKPKLVEPVESMAG